MTNCCPFALVAALCLSCDAAETRSAPAWTEATTTFDRPLNAVWVASSTDAVAVGEGGLIVEFDGRRWTPVASPTTEHLVAIWGSGTPRTWALGIDGAILTRRDGAWSLSDAGGGATLRAVCGRGPEDVWVFGDAGIALRNTGDGFAAIEASLPERIRGAFMDPSGTGLVVGAESGASVTALFDGRSSWARAAEGPELGGDSAAGIVDVWGRVEAGESVPSVWGAGTTVEGDGVLARWRESRWEIVTRGLGDRPAAVLPTAEGVWLGASTALLRVEPATPESAESHVVAGPVRDIQGAADLLVAVGGRPEGRIWTRTPRRP